MSYTKTVWKSLPDTSTPITADRLNNIENGVEYLYENGLIAQNLPIGSEVEYSGQVSDIPAGWEQTGVLQQTLWTNSDVTQAISQTTNITLSSSNYDMLEIYYIQATNMTSLMYSNKILKGASTRMRISTTDGANIYRGMTYLSDTSYRIDLPYSETTLSNINSLAIPYKIIGYKNVPSMRIKRVS